MLEPNTTTANMLIRLGIPCFIIFMNIVFLSHNTLWFTLITLIMIQLFLYLSCFTCILYFKEKYEKWRHRRRITRHIRQRTKIQKNLNNSIIYNFKEECIICLEPLEGAIKLKCNHIYHRHCLDQMLEYNILTCPLCRADIL